MTANSEGFVYIHKFKVVDSTDSIITTTTSIKPIIIIIIINIWDTVWTASNTEYNDRCHEQCKDNIINIFCNLRGGGRGFSRKTGL